MWSNSCPQHFAAENRIWEGQKSFQKKTSSDVHARSAKSDVEEANQTPNSYKVCLWKRRAVGAYGHTATTACRNYNTEECRRHLASRKKSLQENETCAKKNEKLLHIRCPVEAEPRKILARINGR